MAAVEAIDGDQKIGYKFTFIDGAPVYHGEMWIVGNAQVSECSFVPYKPEFMSANTLEEQQEIVSKIYTINLKLSHPNVLKVLFVTFNAEKGQHLVAYENFNDFLKEDFFKASASGMIHSDGYPMSWDRKSVV